MPLGNVDSVFLEDVLAELESEMLQADTRGGEAFQKSKYSIAEYWLCIVFRFRTVYKRIAKRTGSDRPLARAEFTEKIAAFRRSLAVETLSESALLAESPPPFDPEA